MASTLSSGKSNFQKVQEFNRAFDMVAKEPANYLAGEIDKQGQPQENAFLHGRMELVSSEPKLIRLRLDLIAEELSELKVAIAANDIIEIRDALADILYVVYGMGDVLGINMDVLVHHLIESLIILRTHANGMSIVERIVTYCNQDETNGRFVGMTNWNWVQVHMDLFPTLFCYRLLESSPTEGTNNQREKLVSAMVHTLTNLEGLCTPVSVSEGKIGMDTLEKIGNCLAHLITLDYTYSYLMNIDADGDFAIVHSSNMSKLCDTEADALATVADYESKFKDGKSPYDSPYYYALPEIGKWIVKNRSTGKALKNIKYQKVVF